MITIIPAIDLIDGRCVRLTKGDYTTEKIYDQNPVKMAESFQKAGATHLHLVDLDAARGLIDKNLDTISSIIRNTDLIIEVGGGIRSIDQIKNLLALGATKVIIGSMAQKDKKLVTSWIKEVGPGHIIIGADVSKGYISIDGWQKESEDKVEDFIQYYLKVGVIDFLCTDVAKDGMLEGPSIELYRSLMNKFPTINIIASGGVSGFNDVLVLNELGMKEVIVGKAIYENRINLEEAIKSLESC